MVERGAKHIKALRVVAARLAELACTVMCWRMPYVICDADGTPSRPSKPSESSPSSGLSLPRHGPGGVAARPNTSRAGKASHQVLMGHDHKTLEA
jgi:hypothetical protein